jgi:hypothetical protein
MFYHNGEVAQALIDLFPEIKLQKSVFLSDRMFLFFFSSLDPLLTWFYAERWEETENRRSFFKLFAVELNFDPKVPENWYCNATNIMSQRVYIKIYNQKKEKRKKESKSF